MMNYEVDLETGNRERIVYDVGDRFKCKVIPDTENNIFTLVSKKKGCTAVSYVLQAPDSDFVQVTRVILARDFTCLEELKADEQHK